MHKIEPAQLKEGVTPQTLPDVAGTLAAQGTARTEPILPQPDMRVLLSANGLSLLVLGILPQPLMALCIASIQYSL